METIKTIFKMILGLLFLILSGAYFIKAIMADTLVDVLCYLSFQTLYIFMFFLTIRKPE